jgi:hypothetical protein
MRSILYVDCKLTFAKDNNEDFQDFKGQFRLALNPVDLRFPLIHHPDSPVILHVLTRCSQTIGDEQRILQTTESQEKESDSIGSPSSVAMMTVIADATRTQSRKRHSSEFLSFLTDRTHSLAYVPTLPTK